MKSLPRILFAAIVGIVVSSTGTASAGEVKLKKGDKAPVFQALDENGKLFKSTDHVGKKVIVVFFYPADFTGGCTKQACGFRDDFKSLAAKGVMVVAVSGDTSKTHALFKKFHKLPFTLLADTKGEVAKKFGVPQGKGGSIERELFGDKLTLTRGVTIRRWTFAIDKQGNIALVNQNVNAGSDSKSILKLVGK